MQKWIHDTHAVVVPTIGMRRKPGLVGPQRHDLDSLDQMPTPAIIASRPKDVKGVPKSDRSAAHELCPEKRH